eukprot:TRINITY_DN8111_c0_g1_i8.p1 TRINITY_DN8111_c0_g1~~TRINITY_DN8111_c0_g1_i8.p1  ORF type:complete len:282 (-),score=26.99 TRINITY_DN8111_c0_g1_i8:200-1045(-)
MSRTEIFQAQGVSLHSNHLSAESTGVERTRTRKYSVISDDARRKFIDRVQKDNLSIRKAAKEMGLKFSTAKAILKTFKSEGRIGKKKFRDRKNKAWLSLDQGQKMGKSHNKAQEQTKAAAKSDIGSLLVDKCENGRVSGFQIHQKAGQQFAPSRMLGFTPVDCRVLPNQIGMDFRQANLASIISSGLLLRKRRQCSPVQESAPKEVLSGEIMRMLHTTQEFATLSQSSQLFYKQVSEMFSVKTYPFELPRTNGLPFHIAKLLNIPLNTIPTQHSELNVKTE